MLMKDVNEVLLDKDQPDTLIDLTSTMNTGTNLQRATVIILFEPVYDPKMKTQIPKRIHRQSNSLEISYYTLSSKQLLKSLLRLRRQEKRDS